MANRDRVSLEQDLLAAGKTKFVTTEAATAAVNKAHYHHFPGTTVTVCCIELMNGFTVIGQSACANPDNFDPELGEQLAYDDAYNQIFRFLAFMMCEKAANPMTFKEAEGEG